jgi:hypothetical protein
MYEVPEIAPHQLRPEYPVGRGARLEGPFQVAVVGGAAPERGPWRLLAADGALAEVVTDRGVFDADEVLLGPARATAVAQRLEVLLGATGNAGFLEPVADERAAAARGGTDDV